MNRTVRAALAILFVAAAAGVVAFVSPKNAAMADLPVITAHVSPTCGCCKLWAEEMEKEGFEVKIVETLDVAGIKQRFDVPAALYSCHTSEVDGYALEGHVPADDIKRLLKERPNVRGLAVAGMPAGSPGMPGGVRERFNTASFTAAGEMDFFARH